MEVPEGVKQGIFGDSVCTLIKSLYSLKQSPRCWNLKIDPFQVDQLVFQKCDGDPFLYVKTGDTGHLMIIALYVDDLLLAGNNMGVITWMKKELNNRFDMKDLGEAKICLGLEITRNRVERKLFLTQLKYMQGVLERFGMEDSRPASTPMEGSLAYEERLKMDSKNGNCESMKNVPYREDIGSLMYLMIGTPPDISFAIGKLPQFCESPLENHWTAVKRDLRFVSGTRTLGLCFDGTQSIDAHGYSDSYWAGDVSDRKSTSAYVFMMYGSALSWCSREQTVAATSSCEAEYIALSAACKEAVWLKRLLQNLLPKEVNGNKMVVFSDSQSAIKLSENESINRRNKHIDITYHFVIDLVARGDIKLQYKSTLDMIADMLTKPLEREKIEKLRDLCGIRDPGGI